jgi:hypothetical protein
MKPRKPIRRARPHRQRSLLKPPVAPKPKKHDKGPRYVHVLLNKAGEVDVILGSCKGACDGLDRHHMCGPLGFIIIYHKSAKEAAGAIRKRCYERAGGLLEPIPGGGFRTLFTAWCECGCGRRVSWERGHLDEKVPRGTTSGGAHESGKMSFDNSQFITAGCHALKHSARNPRLKWMRESA